MSSIKKRLLRPFDLLGLNIFFNAIISALQFHQQLLLLLCSALVASSSPAVRLLKKTDQPAADTSSYHISSCLINKLSPHQSQANNIGPTYSVIQEIFFCWRIFATRTFRQKVFI
jgi:hypothetical protein